MQLSGIIAISGRPGLFKVIAQSKNSVIVESMIDKKRFPAYATERISTLDDISVFTYDEDVKLTDIFAKMLELYSTEAPSHKADMKELETALAQFLPNWDQDRVYPSDVRKLFQWFNLLNNAGAFAAVATEETTATKEVKAPKAETAKKKAPSATPAAKAAKPAAPKKPTAVKTGSSRGK
jgi:thioester reductase-like protein